MCVLALAWQAHPDWLLVCAGNRDEYHARPAAPLSRWSGMLAGRDLLSGGTWMGVSEAGRFAVVTNLRGHGGPAPDAPSRGGLVTGWLDGSADPVALPDAALARYAPVNLIVADAREARFVSNRPDVARVPLAPGLYGLSNGALDAPWPKTLRLKSRLLDWTVQGDAAPEALFDALREEVLPPVGRDPATPSDVPEPAHSPIFLRDAVYGTRCSTVVAIRRDGAGVILERRFAADGSDAGETRLAFRW